MRRSRTPRTIDHDVDYDLDDDLDPGQQQSSVSSRAVVRGFVNKFAQVVAPRTLRYPEETCAILLLPVHHANYCTGPWQPGSHPPTAHDGANRTGTIFGNISAL